MSTEPCGADVLATNPSAHPLHELNNQKSANHQGLDCCHEPLSEVATALQDNRAANDVGAPPRPLHSCMVAMSPTRLWHHAHQSRLARQSNDNMSWPESSRAPTRLDTWPKNCSRSRSWGFSTQPRCRLAHYKWIVKAVFHGGNSGTRPG